MSAETVSAELCSYIRNAPRAAFYLDFDGTLSPFVERVEEARLPEPVRDTLARLAADPRFMIAIVSGRSLEDVRRRVGIPGLVYAGNHGLEIEGSGLSLQLEEDQITQTRMRAVIAKLNDVLPRIPGAQVEDKRLTASVHFRRVEPSRRSEVEAIVRAAVPADDPNLITRDAILVTEIRPRFHWNKGDAVLWIGRQLNIESSLEVYIGDDATDEDAFKVLPEGFTIHVGTFAETAARYRLANPAEVAVLLKTVLNEASLQ